MPVAQIDGGFTQTRAKPPVQKQVFGCGGCRGNVPAPVEEVRGRLRVPNTPPLLLSLAVISLLRFFQLGFSFFTFFLSLPFLPSRCPSIQQVISFSAFS